LGIGGVGQGASFGREGGIFGGALEANVAHAGNSGMGRGWRSVNASGQEANGGNGREGFHRGLLQLERSRK
jgi:hypothetical protein